MYYGLCTHVKRDETNQNSINPISVGFNDPKNTAQPTCSVEKKLKNKNKNRECAIDEMNIVFTDMWKKRKMYTACTKMKI